MATVEPARALPVYQQQYGILRNEILMRDIAINDLEEQNGQLRARIAELEAQEQLPAEA